jgi:lysophospholipase L1-like esterase
MTLHVLSRRAWLLACAVGAAHLAACGRKVPPAQAIPAGATVLALGDSLTAGVGATPDSAFTPVLERLTGWHVVNAGVSGDTSAQALARLPGLLSAHRPSLVIVSIGGNDFLRRVSEATTRANVRQICTGCTASGAQVLLVAVPQPSLLAAAGVLSDHALYAEIAQELLLPLHAGGWAEVLSDPALRSDAVHANAAGYERFARHLAGAARALGLLQSA